MLQLSVELSQAPLDRQPHPLLLKFLASLVWQFQARPIVTLQDVDHTRCARARVCACVCVCVRACVRVHVCMCVCACVQVMFAATFTGVRTFAEMCLCPHPIAEPWQTLPFTSRWTLL